MPSADELRSRLARAFEARKFDLALRTLKQLTKEEPREPKWPLQAARLFHSRRDARNELGALRRALELQVDRGLVLEAIASCKAILELAPEDAQTLDTLDLLYLEGPSSSPDDENPLLSLGEMNTNSEHPLGTASGNLAGRLGRLPFGLQAGWPLGLSLAGVAVDSAPERRAQGFVV